METISPVSSTPDVASFIALRKALDGLRTPADGVVPALEAPVAARTKPGTPAAARVDSARDTYL